MTSSSDHPSWVPGSLSADGATGLAPAFADLRVEPPPSGAPAWLRPLRSTREEELEIERAGQRVAAYRRGVDEATRNERNAAEQRCATALLAVKRVAEHLDTVATEFARDRERDLHGLAVAIARQIVQHELMIDPLRVGELVRRALELLPLDTTIEVRLNPADLATLGEATERTVPPGRAVRLTWLADPGLEPGNFVIESPQRIVDGRSDVALRDLYERLEHE
jgi:flagellar biosynthesis/type III secretory pathway protein FliH